MSAQQPQVSVIVPTHRGDAWIGECLDTLAAQTLAPPDFEIVIVQNGPKTGTRELVQAWCARNRAVCVQYLESKVASVSSARNLGLEAARGQYVTFVDDDDRVGPRFLEGLLAAARPDAVSIALGAWIYGGRWDEPTYRDYTAALPRAYAGQPYSNLDIAALLHPVWAKLVLTSLARAVRFDESLSGYAEDTVFWLRTVEAAHLRLVLGDLSPAAAYLYRVREGSLTRWGGATDWDTHVEAPLRAAAALGESADPEFRAMGAVLARAPFGRMNEYLREHPEKSGRVMEALRDRGIDDVPWQILCAGLPTELAVIGSLTGPLDSRGQTPGGRLVERGRPADAFTYAAPGADAATPLAAAAGLVSRHVALTGPSAVTWDLLSSLVQSALGTIASLEEQNATYGAVFSYSAGPLEHLLAAMVRLARPGTRWEAELVDPLAGVEVPGVGAAVNDDWLLEVFGAGLVEAGYAGEEVPSTMDAFAELVVCVLADEVTFATQWQRDEVLARLEPALAVRTRARARVRHSAVEGRSGAVSVIVPTHQGDRWLERSLRCLATQTLRREAFEVVVVRNGPPSRAEEIVARIAAEHEGLQLRLLDSPVGVSRARNVGLAAARGEYVTFVDDDDRVGSRYLEGLLAVAGRDAVGIAPMYEARGGEPIRDGWLSRPLALGATSRVEMGACLHSAWAKIVSTDLARGVGFDPSLTYGEDTLFWTTLVLRHDLRLVAAPFRDDTAYIWERRLGSATTAAATFEVSVGKQLDVIAAIVRLDAATPELAAVRDDVVRRFQGWAAGWLGARPRDLRRFVTAVQTRGLDVLDWTSIHAELGRRLTPVEATV